jgi:hypothetical protein
MATFLAEKSQRLYKTLICPDKIGIARLASEHPVSSTGQAFEQPLDVDFPTTLLPRMCHSVQAKRDTESRILTFTKSQNMLSF